MTVPKTVSVVEIELPKCTRTYGSAPCTASVGVTGDFKCFNTPGTCQDRANYAETTVEMKFCKNASYLTRDYDAMPIITGIEVSPSVVSLGRSLGHRESVRVELRDRPHSDAGGVMDPYLADRAYDPFDQGTFLGKFRARHPFLRSRPLALYQGYLGEALAAMEARHYLIDSFDGPRPDGGYTLTAKDPLKSWDDARALAPEPSNGFLVSDITDVATSATLSPSGIGNAEYPASGHAAIAGKEICSFTRSGDVLTLTRAQSNTVAVAHKAQDRVQLCLIYSGVNPANIIADLAVNYAGTDTGLIPIDDWTAETDSYLDAVYTTVIAEPTGVATLISELIVQAALSMWWDPVSELIRLRVLRPVETDAFTFDESNSFNITVRDQPDLRVSKVVSYFARSNPLKKLDDLDNYKSMHVTVDLDAEADYGSPAVFRILSRWIPEGGRSIVESMNTKHLARYRDPPRQFTFEVARRQEMSRPELGTGYLLTAWPFQDATGAAIDVPIQLTSVRPGEVKTSVEAEEMLFADVDAGAVDHHVIIYDFNSTNKNARTSHDTLYGSPAAGDIVDVYVMAGVTIGSTSTASPALDVGSWLSASSTGNRTSGSPILTGIASTATWTPGMRVTGTGIPAGAKILTVDSGTQITLTANATSGAGTATTLTIYTVIVNVYFYGKVQGKGGKGGNGGTQTAVGENGGAGGTAFYTRYPVFCYLESTGVMHGGGGGGGGGQGGATIFSGFPFSMGGGGGGGGSGTNPGDGGALGSPGGTAGNPGTSSAGGTGGLGRIVGAAHGGNGGTGGNPGTAGANGTNNVGAIGGPYLAAGTGGAAGYSTDGFSYVVWEVATGTVAGAQVN